MLMYLSGPITGNPDYKDLFDRAAAKLGSLGYGAINPAALPEVMPVSKMGYEEILDVCLSLLDKADAMCLLPGWEKSRGANRELGYAIGKHMLIWEMDLDATDEKYALLPFCAKNRKGEKE